MRDGVRGSWLLMRYNYHRGSQSIFTTKSKNLFDSSFWCWPIWLINNPTLPLLAMVVFLLLLAVGHLTSFMYTCVWYYEPSLISSCHNHRPALTKQKQIVELKISQSSSPGPASAEVISMPRSVSPTTVLQSAGTISVDANIRAGAGMGYPIISTLHEGIRVEILAVQDGWYKIRRIDLTLPDEAGPVGWVWKDLLE